MATKNRLDISKVREKMKAASQDSSKNKHRDGFGESALSKSMDFEDIMFYRKRYQLGDQSVTLR